MYIHLFVIIMSSHHAQRPHDTVSGLLPETASHSSPSTSGYKKLAC